MEKQDVLSFIARLGNLSLVDALKGGAGSKYKQRRAAQAACAALRASCRAGRELVNNYVTHMKVGNARVVLRRPS